MEIIIEFIILGILRIKDNIIGRIYNFLNCVN